VLYFTFELTREILEEVPKTQRKFVRRRWLISAPFAFKTLGTLTVLMLLPCGIYTSTTEELLHLSGESCVREWGDYILGAYVVGYTIIFLWFAFKLREVVDGFMLKPEMKITGVMGIFMWLPWIVFNSALQDLNIKVFPFSTLFLVLGASLAFIASTVWPLYRSLKPPMMELDNVPEDISSLQGLLSHKAGVASFKKFLTKEFSVENILFYEEIEEYRNKIGKGADEMELIGEAQRLYAKYIIVDSPFQVNLPDHIVRDLENKLKDIFAMAGAGMEVMTTSGGKKSISSPPEDRGHHRQPSEALLPHQRDTPTIFDRAQENIFKLMSTDSFPRYQRSEEYRRFVEEVETKRKKKRVLVEEGVTADDEKARRDSHIDVKSSEEP